jgi:serine/threonine protein kinase
MVGGIVDGKYRLARLLGEGGMGSVYEAEPLKAAAGTGNVALKLIRPDILDRRDVASLARFHREAKAASAVDADHIVRVLTARTSTRSSTAWASSTPRRSCASPPRCAWRSRRRTAPG